MSHESEAPPEAVRPTLHTEFAL